MIECQSKPENNSSSNNIAAIALTLILVVVFLIPSVLLLHAGFYPLLPEPHYISSSINEVLYKEIFLSFKNVAINFVVLTVVAFISLVVMFTNIFKFTKLKTIFFCMSIAFIISLLLPVFDIILSMKYWQILDKATMIYENKLYNRGRGGGLGLQKEYFIQFTIPSNNVQTVRDILIPALEKEQFSIDPDSTGAEAIDNLELGEKFLIMPENKNYLSINLEKSNKDEYFSINLVLENETSRGGVVNKVKPGTIEGYLTMYPYP